MIPLVIYDFRVLAHQIYHKLPEENQEKWVKACWAILLNRGPQCTDYYPHSVLIADDNGQKTPYWRKQLFPPYKEGRKPKTDAFMGVSQLGLNYVLNPKNPCFYLSEPGYEADDFAGLLVAVKRLFQLVEPDSEIANREIHLLTVDSDWLQLVGNGVTWYNTGPWEPRIRDHKGALDWAKKRLKVDLKHPHEIVKTKCIQGDKSDNLPPGTPSYMIDLLNPHPDYNLLFQKEWFLQAVSILKDNTCANNLDHLEKARDYIFSNGLPYPS